MNRFTASLFALGLGVGAVLMAGCGAAPSPDDTDGDNANLFAVTPPPPDPPPGCDRYEAYSSALAEFAVDCTGSIGPDSFLVDPRGFLRRNFQSCIPRLSTRNDLRNPLKDVDALLSLQLPGPEKFLRSNDDGSPVLVDKGVLLPPIHVCLATAWKFGLWKYASDGRPPCPTWTKVGVDPKSDEPNAEGIAQFSKGLPSLDGSTQVRPPPVPKENFYYAVEFTPAQERLAQSVSPLFAAEACSTGLPGFFVRSERQVTLLRDSTKPVDKDNIAYQGPAVLGDPLWWLDPTYYAPGSDPYMVADYYHPMSFYRDLPGARFGHINRVGEACSYWNGAYHMIGQLRAYCIVASDYPSGPSCNMTHCEDKSIVNPTPTGP